MAASFTEHRSFCVHVVVRIIDRGRLGFTIQGIYLIVQSLQQHRQPTGDVVLSSLCVTLPI